MSNHRAVLALVYAALAVTVLFLVGNGLWMLWDPLGWYNLVPGVVDTGGYNQHFIRDIGLIKLFIGIGFILGMAWVPHRSVLWGAGAAWLTGHAFFHFWEVAVGICSPAVLPRDFPAVTLPAIITVLLTFWSMRQPRGAG